MPDIFDQEDTDYLAQITGPGGKFDKSRYASDAELQAAMAKSIFNADKTIAAKNQEFDQLREDSFKWREEALAKANLDDYAARMSRKDDTSTFTPVDTKPQLDADQIKKLASEQALSAYEQIKAREKQESNLNVVDQRLKQRFGDRARSMLNERMNALNLTQDDVRHLASRSPDAVINALGLNDIQQQSYDSLPRSSINSDSFKPQTVIRDAVYYEDLRRDKPKEYFSEKMSVQRIKDMDHPDFMKRYEERQSRAGGY